MDQVARECVECSGVLCVRRRPAGPTRGGRSAASDVYKGRAQKHTLRRERREVQSHQTIMGPKGKKKARTQVAILRRYEHSDEADQHGGALPLIHISEPTRPY